MMSTKMRIRFKCQKRDSLWSYRRSEAFTVVWL